jgi:putative DNA primase/helicase
MRQDNIDFYPDFKLLIAGNHKPGLRSVNEAIRRRLQLVPFLVQIPKETRDTQFGEKLKAEWPGILQWMVEGCLEWQRIGLAPPKAVTEAVDDYLEAQDLVSQWVSERCEVNKKAKEASSRLFGSWQAWCELQGEKPGTQRAFNDDLQQKGFKRFKEERSTVFYGLQLGDKERASQNKREEQQQRERDAEKNLEGAPNF